MSLEPAIMRRVYPIWLGRAFCRSSWAKLALLVGLGWGTLTWVSPVSVWHNANLSEGFWHYGYYAEALTQTETVVQVLLSLALVVLLWWLKDVTRRLGFFSRARF